MQEPTREMMERSLPTSYNSKCPRCGHTRWMTFKDAMSDIMCSRCYYYMEGELSK